MKTSENGLKIIKQFEGLRLTAYRDVAGIWTIGYGSCYLANGKHVQAGDKLSDESQADLLIRQTLGQYEDAVNHDVHITLNQNQFDALVSFTYNEGTGALYGSTLLKLLNQGDYKGAASHFADWNKVTIDGKHVVNEDLTERRAEEAKLFLS